MVEEAKGYKYTVVEMGKGRGEEERKYHKMLRTR